MSSKKVIVGVNPSYDSLATLILLKLQHFELTAIHVVLKGYDPENLVNSTGVSCLNQTNENLLNEILSLLEIPLFYVDQKEVFYEQVVGHSVIANFMKEGNNPCLDCHRIRLMCLYQKMIKLNADHFATGHYAKIRKAGQDGLVNVYKNSIEELDQHYYLAGVDQRALSHLLLPLSDLSKEKVISIVKEHLPKHHHKLSQSKKGGMCLVTSDMPTTIKKKIAPSLHKKSRLYLRENKTFLNEAYDNTEFDFGKQFKMGRDRQGKEQILEVTGFNYSYQTIYVSDLAHKKEANYFYVQVVEFFGKPHFYSPGPCLVSIDQDKGLMQATLYPKGLNYALIILNGVEHPFVPSKSMMFVSEETRLGNKLIFLTRIVAQGTLESSQELAPMVMSKVAGDYPF